MKNRIIAIVIACVFLFSFAAFSISAEGDNQSLLMDSAGLLSAEEQATLSVQLNQISENQQFTVAIATVPLLPDGTTLKDQADFLYNEQNFGYGTNRDGCLLLYVADSGEFDITAFGFGEEAITPYTDDLKSVIQSGNYFESFTKYAELCESYISDAIESVEIDWDLLMDSAGLLTEEEQEALLSQLKEISERQQFTVAIVTLDSLNSDITPQEFADYLYEEGNYGYGENKDGCLLLRTLDPRYVYVTTTGFGQKAIDSDTLEDIFDEIESDMHSDNYFAAFQKFAELCDKKVSDARTFPLIKYLLI